MLIQERELKFVTEDADRWALRSGLLSQLRLPQLTTHGMNDPRQMEAGSFGSMNCHRLGVRPSPLNFGIRRAVHFNASGALRSTGSTSDPCTRRCWSGSR